MGRNLILGSSIVSSCPFVVKNLFMRLSFVINDINFASYADDNTLQTFGNDRKDVLSTLDISIGKAFSIVW